MKFSLNVLYQALFRKKNTNKQANKNDHTCLRDVVGQSCTIYSFIHANRMYYLSMLYFALGGSIVYKSSTWEKLDRQKVLSMLNNNIKFVEESRYVRGCH